MPVGKKGVTFYGEVTGSILTDVPSGKEASQPMYIPNTDLNQGCQAADVVLKVSSRPFMASKYLFTLPDSCRPPNQGCYKMTR